MSNLRRLPYVVAAVILTACGRDEAKPFDFDALPPTPAEHREGERLFDANCASCHGAQGRGTQQGPPLVHKIYEPSHHGDAAFQMAVERGVAAHHWRFGNMQPVPGVTPQQVAAITGYVRWVQRLAGID